MVKQKPKKLSEVLPAGGYHQVFTEAVKSHTFEIKRYVKLTNGAKFKCEFCGGIGFNCIEIIRDDGRLFKVGYTCLQRPAVKVTGADKKVVMAKPKPEKKAKPEKAVKPEKDRAKTAVAKKLSTSGHKVKVTAEVKTKSDVKDDELDKMLGEL